MVRFIPLLGGGYNSVSSTLLSLYWHCKELSKHLYFLFFLMIHRQFYRGKNRKMLLSASEMQGWIPHEFKQYKWSTWKQPRGADSTKSWQMHSVLLGRATITWATYQTCHFVHLKNVEQEWIVNGVAWLAACVGRKCWDPQNGSLPDDPICCCQLLLIWMQPVQDLT